MSKLEILRAAIRYISILEYCLGMRKTPLGDESYDATTEEVDYKDWDEGKWSKANRPKFCSGAEKQQICNCESNGGRSDLLCASHNLVTTDAELPQNFNPSDKILPGKESNVLSLDFSSNLISDIQPGTFNQFTKLQVLMLTHNKLDSDQISVDVFTPSLGESLHQLYLDYNFITTLDEGVFDNLSQLKKLVLDGNREIQLSRGVFTNAAFDVLEVLSLDKCSIKELDEHIFANLTYKSVVM
uniref:LRRNT domain-containing protein n=1 Tax=Globodera pallida TaxID=36090 RepID=A0A183CPI3_GLOPA